MHKHYKIWLATPNNAWSWNAINLKYIRGLLFLQELSRFVHKNSCIVASQPVQLLGFGESFSFFATLSTIGMCCYPVTWCIINSLLDLNKVLDLNKRAVMLYESGMIQPLDYAFIDCNRTWSSIWNVAFLQDRHNQRHHVAHGPELWHRSRCVMWWFRGSFVAKRMWLKSGCALAIRFFSYYSVLKTVSTPVVCCIVHRLTYVQTDRYFINRKKIITNLFVIEMREIYVHVYTRLLIW